MNLLGSANYDPAAAVSKATSALLAMTALDTTNLRLAITVPAHGKVLFRFKCNINGATTMPAILLGALNGATVLGRQVPQMNTDTQSVATHNAFAWAEFVATGLTPGAMNVDAAYAVQVVVAATNIKYGGPNTNAGVNAWGGFVFEAWDPQPIPTVAPGVANGLQICGANAATTYASLTVTAALTVNGVSAVSQTGDAFARLGAAGAGLTALGDTRLASLDATISGRMASYTQPTGFLAATFPASVASPTNITAGTITNLTNAPTVGDLTAAMKTSVTTAATAATPTVAAVTGAVGSVTGSVGSVATGGITAASIATDAIGAVELAADAATEIGTAVWAAATRTLTGSSDPTAATIASAIRTELATELGRVDVAVSTRNATTPLDAAGTRSAVGLATANLDTQLDALPTSAELTTALGTADDAVLAQVALVKAKTDNLPSAVAIADEVQTRTLAAVTMVNGLAANVVNASAIATDAVTKIQADLATQSSVDAMPTNAELATALVGPLPVDVKKVNGVVVIGVGSEGDRWRPAT